MAYGGKFMPRAMPIFLSAIIVAGLILCSFIQSRSTSLDAQPVSTLKSVSVAKPPTGAANAITDFAVYTEGLSIRPWWRYRNAGDYDQDGTVGVSDLTPIAANYDVEIFDENTVEGVIGWAVVPIHLTKVNVAAITPIAQYYGVRCDGYVLQNASSADGPWNSIASIPFSEGQGMGRKLFQPILDRGLGSWYRVRPFCGAQVGEPSNAVQWGS
jgi:hypothetical protein